MSGDDRQNSPSISRQNRPSATLYPKEHLQKAISDNPNSVYRIWESLKGISGNDIEEEGRIYGGGLKKIEPSELAKVSCGDLMKLCFA